MAFYCSYSPCTTTPHHQNHERGVRQTRTFGADQEPEQYLCCLLYTSCAGPRQFLWVLILRPYSPGGTLNALAPARRGSIPRTPVSYTHLIQTIFQPCGISLPTLFPPSYLSSGTGDHIPVSYTHLDVYKRQEYNYSFYWVLFIFWKDWTISLLVSCRCSIEHINTFNA